MGSGLARAPVEPQLSRRCGARTFNFSPTFTMADPFTPTARDAARGHLRAAMGVLTLRDSEAGGGVVHKQLLHRGIRHSARYHPCERTPGPDPQRSVERINERAAW